MSEERFVERRASPRQAVADSVRFVCRRAGAAENVALEISNVSTGGARFRSGAPLRIADSVMLSISGPALGEPIEVAATVRWCARGPEGQNEVGVRFQQPLSDAQMRSLTGQSSS
jgi:hypothetical protein